MSVRTHMLSFCDTYIYNMLPYTYQPFRGVCRVCIRCGVGNKVTYSPVGSMPLIPLQIAKSSVIDCIDEGEPIINTELGLSLASTFSATRFEVQTVVEDDNSNVAMITFWVPRDLNFSFPCRTKKA